MSFDAATISFEVNAPTLTVNIMVVGANLTAPAPDISTNMLVPISGFLIPGAPQITTVWSAGQKFIADFEAAAPSITSTPDGIWGVLIEAPTADLSNDWTIGGTFTITLSAPAPGLSGKTDNAWVGKLNPPAPAVSARMYVELLWEAAIAATSPDLTIAFIEVNDAVYDEDTDAWVVNATTWCVNASSSAHSEYKNFNFNSYAKFNGQDIALNDNGVFVIGGDTDDGEDVDAKVMFAPSNFGTGQKNRVDSAYINVRGAAAMSLVTVFDEETVRKYAIDFDNDQRGAHTKRRKVGKGLTGNNIQIGIENRDGSRFDIESMEVVAVPLLRKS